MPPTDDPTVAESPDEELLNVAQVARRAKVHRETVRRWAESGLIESIVLPSGHRRFRKAAVDAMLTPHGLSNAEPHRATG